MPHPQPHADQSTHPAAWPADRLRSECELRFSRRSGPGGQHRNKVETAVTLTHRSTGISAEANERRTQADNLRVALRRLRTRLALLVREPWSAPSLLWRSRCRQRRLAVSVQHEDYPSLLAEALDALQAHDWQVPAAAASLGCTASQLVRLLRRHPEGLGVLNRERVLRGARPLR